jgi:hypothetical protein
MNVIACTSSTTSFVEARHAITARSGVVGRQVLPPSCGRPRLVSYDQGLQTVACVT